MIEKKQILELSEIDFKIIMLIMIQDIKEKHEHFDTQLDTLKTKELS